MNKSTINNNQKAINYFTKRWNTTRLRRDEVSANFQESFSALVNTSNWEQWDAIVEVTKSTTVKNVSGSSNFTAWVDQAGFEFMKPRMIERLLEKHNMYIDILQNSIDDSLTQLEKLK